jgi:subtilase family serine protease
VALNGAGQAVGLFELDGFYAADVQSNFQQAGLAPVPTETVLLNGYSGAAGNANTEVILDIMMAAYMAPGLSKVIVYEGTNWNDVLNRMATENRASQLSSSWCFSPTNATTEQIFSQMIAQGQSLFQASGDSGAYHGWIMPPADDPNVTVVGGTSLTTTGPGGAWLSESAWSGSGGGVSTTWPIPNYQKALDMAALGGSSTMRNIPDVALTADVQIFLICNNGQWISVGGTSAAAPLWAGFLALANQQAAAGAKPPVGFVNPAIYAIGAGSSFTADLHDITSGYNGFNALVGFDLATGWGSPQGQALIDALTGVSNAPTFGLTSSASSLAIAAGASGTSTITINPQNGFSGQVSLSASGLPAGVTASFNPATATTTSTLTLSASASAASSNSTVAITATSGSISTTARLSLRVTGAAGFTISASDVNVKQGSQGTSAVTIVPQNGFTGTVALSASKLPAGVTASFSPVSAAKTSTLTLTASASAAPGVYSVNVTGTSGSFTSTAAISLTIAGTPSYTISASPSSLTVVRGSRAATTVSVTPLYGFTGNVSFAATGLPSGVTAIFGVISSSQPGTLTLTVSTSAAVGSSTITITGTSGTLRTTATIALTVVAAPTFTIGAAPASLSILEGASGSSAITVTALNGFSGSVNLAVTNRPAGVTGSFSATTDTTSTLTLTASPTAATGPATVSVTGTSGSLVIKTTIALTVTARPTFTLTAPATLNVAVGASSASGIAINSLYGFNGAVALSASGLPTGVTATFSEVSAGRSTVTFAASAGATPGATPITITGVSGSITSKAVITLNVVSPPNFALSVFPSSLSLAQGSIGTSAITLTPLNGFTGTVALSISGLPSGVVASIASGAAPMLKFSITASAAPSQSTITLTGKFGSLTQTATIALTVLAPASGNTMVNLAPFYNVPAIVADSSTFVTGGLDGGGRAYSAALLGPLQIVNGTPFSFGPANTFDAVSSATIPLPSGHYSTITLLASGVNGNQTAQTFVVTYTDGTTSTFTQNLSDWCTPQTNPGESRAIAMNYRNNSTGTRDSRLVALYGYTFTLASGKTLSSITLPKNRNVVVLAMSLATSATANSH